VALQVHCHFCVSIPQNDAGLILLERHHSIGTRKLQRHVCRNLAQLARTTLWKRQWCLWLGFDIHSYSNCDWGSNFIILAFAQIRKWAWWVKVPANIWFPDWGLSNNWSFG
jgi:hypothetical protein